MALLARSVMAHMLANHRSLHRHLAAPGGVRSMIVSAQSTAGPKAAIMVIGDEVLSGSVTDTNTPWLAKLLYSRGVDLVRAEYVPDDEDDIVETLLRLRQRVGPDGAIFTSGGIGPTHDDITYAAVAKALGLQLEVHQATVERMKAHYARQPGGLQLNEARLRMATLPAPADEVLVTDGIWVPLVRCGGGGGSGAMGGVYILPGIPRLFQQMVAAHQERFTGPTFNVKELYTKLPEGDLAAVLTAIAAAHKQVSIGSYPNVTAGDERYKVKLQFSSRDPDALEAAVDVTRLALVHVFEAP